MKRRLIQAADILAGLVLGAVIFAFVGALAVCFYMEPRLLVFPALGGAFLWALIWRSR